MPPSTTTNNTNAELTNRLIDSDPDFDFPEWEEKAILDGVPISIFYRTTPEDEEMCEENGGDWGAVDWFERIDRIEFDLYKCDQNEITGKQILAVAKKFGLSTDGLRL